MHVSITSNGLIGTLRKGYTDSGSRLRERFEANMAACACPYNSILFGNDDKTFNYLIENGCRCYVIREDVHPPDPNQFIRDIFCAPSKIPEGDREILRRQSKGYRYVEYLIIAKRHCCDQEGSRLITWNCASTIGGDRFQHYQPKSQAERLAAQESVRSYLRAYETFSCFDYLYMLPDADMLMRSKYSLVNKLATPNFVSFCKTCLETPECSRLHRD